MGKPRRCTVVGCRRRSISRRMCTPHYEAAIADGTIGFYQPTGVPRERDRKVCPPDHKHAETTTCYIQHQCRCDECSEMNRARQNRRDRLIAYGRYDSGLVDAAPARSHVLRLSEQGLGYKRVAQLAGLHTTTLRILVSGREDGPRKGELAKRIKRGTAEKILAVEATVDVLGARAAVPAAPYVRRLQALVALGWSQSELARRIGSNPSNFRYLHDYEAAGSHRHRVTMGARTARRIVALYDEISNQAPPETTHRERLTASRTRNFARRPPRPEAGDPHLATSALVGHLGPADQHRARRRGRRSMRGRRASPPRRARKGSRMTAPTERQLLEFEAKNRRHTTRKEAEIPRQLGITAARYYQLLNRLIWLEEALEIDPMLTNALRRKSMQKQRDRARTLNR